MAALGQTGGEARKERLRLRHDGFTPARQKAFLKTLGETGCVRDACRVAGVSSTTAYRCRERLAGFAERWDTALAMAATELEAVAWKRAVEGVEVQTIRKGKVVASVKKPSDSILRLLMQGANPAKYGRTGGKAGPCDEAAEIAAAAEKAGREEEERREAEAAIEMERKAAWDEIHHRLNLIRDYICCTNLFDVHRMSNAEFWVALQVAQAAFEARFGEPAYDFVYRPGCAPGSADFEAWKRLARQVEARRTADEDWDWGLAPGGVPGEGVGP
jgi:hypothetical protein